ncbi:MAG TPA: hypothetical protein P5514_04230 [Bacteroidales bacterium]|nr:hypothetical protein [Bacteroidales bacterium]HRX96126.1 hypothetical protein [Bacteroidales bacterium]
MKTKKSILATVLFLFFAFSISAQNQENEFNSSPTKSSNTELNIGVADIFAKPYLVFYDAYYIYPVQLISYAKSPGLVLGMKFHNQNGAFRLSSKFSYQKRHLTDPDNADYDYSDSDNLAYWFYAGHEWHSRFKRATIFYGFDLAYGHEKYKAYNEQFGDINESSRKTNAVGLSPLIGFNYFLTPQISLGTEFKINFLTFTAKDHYHSESSDGIGNYYYSDSETKETGSDINFGPLGYLSLNIYF